jgi:hypothetical protein
LDIEQKGRGIEFEILGKRLNEIYVKTIEHAQRAQSHHKFGLVLFYRFQGLVLTFPDDSSFFGLLLGTFHFDPVCNNPFQRGLFVDSTFSDLVYGFCCCCFKVESKTSL